MHIEPAVVDHLGLNMYTSIPAVISELVANAWDADATHVEVTIHETAGMTSAISVTDDGHGMTFEEVQAKYLLVGRNRRKADGETTSKGRPLMGRKGIGKLAGFGVVNTVEVRTVRDGRVTQFLLEIEKMRAAGPGRPYNPELLQDDVTGEQPGTVVTLRGLKRRRPVDLDDVRVGLARRFTILGHDFVVAVNGVPLTVADRDLQRRCEFTWIIGTDLPGTVHVGGRELPLSGWIGTFKETVPQDIGNGVAIMVRGKMAQEPTLYDIVKSHGQVAWSYIVGEVTAEFLDQPDKDLIATPRDSVVWESEEGVALKDWIRSALQTVAREWVARRGKAHEQRVRENTAYRAWLDGLSDRDRRHAERVIAVVGSLPKATDAERDMLMEYVVSSFERRSFLELLHEIEALPEPEAAALLKLSKDLKVVEAKEIMRVLELRLAAIRQLTKLIESEAREVPDVHKFLAENAWFLDATWTVVHDEVTYAKLLKAEFPDSHLPVEKRRIDFVCVGTGDTIHVVELKRPGLRVGTEELHQLTDYVTFVRDHLGTHPTKGYRDAAGYLIAGELEPRARTAARDVYGRGRIYFFSYTDLVSNAEKVHQAFVQKTARLAKGGPDKGIAPIKGPTGRKKQPKSSKRGRQTGRARVRKGYGRDGGGGRKR